MFCEACQFGKMCKKSFKSTGPREYKIGEFIHSDFKGPYSVPSYGGHPYFVTFINDTSGMCFLYLLRTKESHEVFEKFVFIVNLIKTQTNQNIKILRSDNGKKYINTQMKNFIDQHGINHQTTAAHTHEQNGKAERMNRTLDEAAESILYATDLPKQLWAESIATAVYLTNRTPSSRTFGKSPYEIWFGHKPSLSHLRKFGSIAYEYIPSSQRRKRQPKAKKRLLVGYENNSSNYRLLDMATKKITISRHVNFNEVCQNNNGEKENWPAIDLSDTIEHNILQDGLESKSVRRAQEISNLDRLETESTNDPADIVSSDKQSKTKEAESFDRQLRDRRNLKPPERLGIEGNYTELLEPLSIEEVQSPVSGKLP